MKALRDHVAGQTLVVWYDPDEPCRATLDPRHAAVPLSGRLAILLVSAVLIFGGLCSLG
jgi:hypothetical protein